MKFQKEESIKTIEKNIAGFNLVIRDIYDKDHKVYWDEKISREMIIEDCYKLNQLKGINSGISTIIDIGAHIGSFAVIANVLWPKAKIKAFEPFPSSFDLLSMNTAHIRQQVELFNCAVAGIKANEVRFLSPSFKFVEAGKLNTGDSKVDAFGDILTETMTLSEIMEAESCDLLKMDCEESELEILAEVCRTRHLTKIKHIRMEVHSEPYLDAINELLRKTHQISIISRISEELFIVKADPK